MNPEGEMLLPLSLPLDPLEALRWKKYSVGSHGFICLVDWMGNDSSIVQAARTSYGKGTKKLSDDRGLIRYLYRHGHTTPFEMVEFKFLVQVPMDIWRQWIRHRMASVNEYSTRYSEALEECAVTDKDAWRAQSANNKQGSAGFLTEWPDEFKGVIHCLTNGDEIPVIDLPDGSRIYQANQNIGEYLSKREAELHSFAKDVYNERLQLGVAKEQARKDLPLSNYTMAYWKIDLKNLLNFLSLRMDSHAQLEIRQFAEAIYDIVKQICPIAVEAFDEYDQRRGGLLLSATEQRFIAAFCKFGVEQDIDLVKAGTRLMGIDAFERAVESTKAQFPNSASGIWGTFAFDNACREVGWPVSGKHREREELRVKLMRMGLLTELADEDSGTTGTIDGESTSEEEKQPSGTSGTNAESDQGDRESSYTTEGSTDTRSEDDSGTS